MIAFSKVYGGNGGGAGGDCAGGAGSNKHLNKLTLVLDNIKL